MSSLIFPTLVGQSIDVTRSPLWDGSSVTTAVSGKETSIAYWNNPRWQWTIKFELLRRGVRYGINRTELDSLIGFFNLIRGQFDSFLYNEPDDNSVLAQGLGNYNGVGMQLIRTLGGFTEPVLAPNVVQNVLANGVPVSPSNYTVSAWGSASPGVITFTASPPNVGDPIVADIVYYWPVRFVDKQMDFKKFMNQLYANEGVKMISKK